MKRRRRDPPAIAEILDKLNDLDVRIARLEEDRTWIRATLTRIEGRMWGLLVGIILSLLAGLIGLITV